MTGRGSLERPRRRGAVFLGGALLAGGVWAGLRLSRGGGAPPELPAPVSGVRRDVEGRAGRLAHYAAGDGAPLLLIHSINAAGSAYEIRPIFEGMRARRRIHALDLPGFGHSDRSARRYDVRLYVDAIHDALDLLAGEGPVDAVALSLSSEFLARAALERPDAFRSLTFVTPTGFDRASAARRAEPGTTREVPGVATALGAGPWGDGLWALLVSRPSIRFFLEKTFGSKRIDEALFDYDHRSTHQPGAKHAPFAFLSGRLFSADAADVYRRLAHPVLMTRATRGDFIDFSGADWVGARPNWREVTFETGALPHFEDPELFCAVLDAFLADPPPSERGGAQAGSSSRSPSP